ncbi:MAG: fatty acid desaturase, partial [Myxococcota bacterium]
MTGTARPAGIPARTNVAAVILAPLAAAGCLAVAARSGPVGIGAAAIGFALVNHTTFALLHEAVHGVLHPDPTVNRWLGRWAAAWFPTSFTLQRALHHTHHRNNRARIEQFDYLHPGERRWLKRAQWYAILTGVYWAFVPALLVTVAVAPGVLRWRILREGAAADQTAASAFLAAVDEAPAVTRREAWASLGFHAATAAAFWA